MNTKDTFLFIEWIKIHWVIKAWPSFKEFMSLRKAYMMPGRFYHTWHHIYECLKFMNKTYGPLPNDHLVKFALFYHDVEYNIPGPNNEANSAKIWQKYSHNLYGKMSRSHADMIANMILMTKSHKPGPNQGLLFQIMSDVDMSILGVDPATYIQYARDIWQEYKSVGREAYRAGRLAFLNTVDPSKLFHTHQAKKLVEIARSNLDAEKALLEENPEIIMLP